MSTLSPYLRQFWKPGLAALALAAVGQGLALLEPLLLRHVIDVYATRYREYVIGEFLKGVSMVLLGVIAVAFASRAARQFRSTCPAGLRNKSALACTRMAYAMLSNCRTSFSRTREGETLAKLQKVRTDVEKLLTLAINVVFATAIGALFVMVYSYTVHWSIAPAYLLAFKATGHWDGEYPDHTGASRSRLRAAVSRATSALAVPSTSSLAVALQRTASF